MSTTASSMSAHTAGLPWNASGVTPKKHRSPVKHTSTSGTSTMMSPAVWPTAGSTSMRGVSCAGPLTMWVTPRVPSSSRSSNSSSNAGMNALYASIGIAESSTSLVCCGAEDRRLRERLRAAAVVDVRVREDGALHRQVERLDRGRERLPLRPHHERVDHGDAVVVDDHPRVRHARLAARAGATRTRRRRAGSREVMASKATPVRFRRSRDRRSGYPRRACPNDPGTCPAAPASRCPDRARRCSARRPASAPTWCSSTSRTRWRRSRRKPRATTS